MRKKLAIIDLGSNSVRMIIMKVYNDGSYKMIDQAKEMVRLSEEMGEEKTLKPLAIQRTLQALRLFRKLIEAHGVDEILPVATAAVRNAVNQQFFLEKIKLETGFEFEVISGEMEAYYDYLGVINTMAVEKGVIIDIGGASTELVWIENRKIKEAISLPYGAITLTEKFSVKEDVSKEKLKKLEHFIEKQFDRVPWLAEVHGIPVIGLGGSIRTLAKIDKRKIGFPLDSLHNYQMTTKEVLQAYESVVKEDLEKRRDMPGVGKERADIIVGGLAPIKILMGYVKSDKLMISGNGVREGIFFKNYFRALEMENEILEDVLLHSVDNTLKNYDTNIKHSYHVKKLALSLFDQTKELHGFGEKERRLLAVGALLHDVGMYVDYYNHHKHGFYLTLNSRLSGLRNRELVICAFIVGMHRNEDLKIDWKDYKMLIDKDDYEIIRKLSLFVRLAEKLDRSEYGSVEDVECYLTKDSVQILLKTTNTPELEIAAAMKNEKVFERLFDRKIYII